MLHGVAADERARAAQARFAVHRDCTCIDALEMLLTSSNEAIDNALTRNRTVHEEEVRVLDAVVSEARGRVVVFVESDHHRDAELMEYSAILVGRESVRLRRLADRAHESQELLGDDPVEVAVLYALVVLVLLDVEGRELVPALFDCKLEALEAMQYRALVVAWPLRGISERLDSRLDLLELNPRVLSSHLENHDHEGAHEEARIGRSLGSALAVVKYFEAFELLVLVAIGVTWARRQLTWRRRVSSRQYLCTIARLRGPKSSLNGV